MGLFQRIVKFIECEYVESWERNLLESVEVTVLGDDIVGSGGDGAVNELIVVLVDVRKQMETEIRLAVNGLGVAGDGVDHVLCYHGRGMHGENFLIFAQYLVTDAQTILARQKVGPNLVVSAS